MASSSNGSPRKGRRRWTLVLVVAHLAGLASTVPALMGTRTPQGTVAWVVSLNTIPLVAVPAYWVFGRSRFDGYVTALRADNREVRDALSETLDEVRTHGLEFPETQLRLQELEHLAAVPYLEGNHVDLLVDGEATYAHLIEGIGRASEYVIAAYFTLRDDDIGRQFGEALAERARAGVRTYLLYDAVGSKGLGEAFVDSLREAGVWVEAFNASPGLRGQRQYQFRNHRKIVVVDGREGWVGGLNVGDEYLGRVPELSPWRDTHLAVRGPAVLPLQLTALEDWYWATDSVPRLRWEVAPFDSLAHTTVLVLPSGPADEVETASLMMQHLIHSARDRFWIASPYFVPDAGVSDALRLAVLRGVDVRVLIPDRPDQFWVYHAAWAFLGDMVETGIGIYRYTDGFLHQKVFVVDDQAAGVGTVNLDNRSLRLNFEVTAVVLGPEFAGRVDRMLQRDFERSRRMTSEDFEGRPWYLEGLARLAYLLAPIL